MVHLTPERYNNTQTAKLSIVRESLPAIKQNIPTTSSTSAVQSSSVSSVASPLPPNSPVLTKSPTKHQGTHDVRRECVQAEITSSTAEAQNCGDCAITEVKKSTGKTVISANPPGARCSISSSYLPEPLASTKLSKIRQGHIASKKREQMKARGMKLPELAESSELETRPKLLAPPPSTDLPMTMLQVKPMMDMPQISVTDEDADIPPTPSDDIVTPSLPDSFLGKLGLCIINSSNGDISKDSTDQLAEKDLESKFVSLSLAFKTDKLTLDKRVTIQERSRDLAEQNVDIELQGLRIAVETVSELVTDVQLRDLLQRIKLHMNVLEQLAARVSSSAEVYGAVQQEKRLCKAMEVMVMYTENLRRIREKEESELHEARKVLQEKSGNSLSVDSDSGPNRRSLSVGGYNSATRMSSTKSQQAHLISNTINDAGDFTDSTSVRRRSEIALPRIIGGAGSPPLTTTATMENLPPFVGQTNTNSMSQESEDGEDPKSKFQSAVASTSMQNVISNTIRRCSLEKRSSVSSTSSMSSSFSSGNTPLSTLSVNKESYPSSVSEHRSENMEVKVSKSEDAFRKGFEEGLKAKLSLELDELRDQQHSLSHNLEQMMDKVEQSQLEDEEYFSRPSRLEATLSLASTMGGHMLQYDWMSNKRIIRNLAGVFFVILAIFVVYHFPPLPTVDVKHVTKPPQ
uniref:Lymphoid-restricted membrane protein n=3 Tax=Arion vulgaris TaxID=1028688 RepID=A0A0B7AB09_9EUPU